MVNDRTYQNLVRVVLTMVFTIHYSLFTFHLPPLFAQTRIMLISDPHVMGPGLLISEGEAWEETLLLDRKLNDYSRAIYDEAIDIALREKPDLFLIPGDLTKDGEVLSHQYVVKRLEDLKAAGIKAYVIPGNHDLGTPEAAYYDGMDSWDAETVDTRQFAELYKDFGYGEGSERESSTLTYCCEPLGNVVLIGIDTGHDYHPLDAAISEETLNWVATRAQRATQAGKTVLVMMHHSLFPHVMHVDQLTGTYSVRYAVPNPDGTFIYGGYTTILNRLSDAGVKVVFSGHVHASDIGKCASEGFVNPVYDVCTATCAASPNPYRMMTLSEDRSELEITTHYIEELPGVENFKEMAEQRMMSGLTRLAMQFVTKEEDARLGASLFMLHVRGNEDVSPMKDEYLQMFYDKLPELKEDPRLLELMPVYSLTFDDLEGMVHSMLEDKSFYGMANRETMVNDLNLTIDLRETGWTSITSPSTFHHSPIPEQSSPIPANAPTRGLSTLYTLQGLQVEGLPRKGVYIRDGRLNVSH